MNVNTLQEFRHAVYGCFKRAGDALFNTVDALSSETGAHSFPELSQSPFFERKWPSLYEALEDGKIDAKQLRRGIRVMIVLHAVLFLACIHTLSKTHEYIYCIV